jgi:hypothetical protein
MRSLTRTPLPSSLVLIILSLTLVAAEPQTGKPSAKAAGRPAAKAAKDPSVWPLPAQMAERKKDAENRRLFRAEAPFPITLVADFKAITRDRNPSSLKTFPATVTYLDEKGATITKALHVRNRGHARRQVTVCDFPPLRLEFGEEKIAKTMFDGQKDLKLGTHCRDVGEFEQYVLREYLAYRIFNLITPQSFRVRLAKVTYVDVVTKNTIVTRYGMFIEDDDDVARRMDGRIIDTQNMMYRHFNPQSATWLGLFEYMIGNTDVSIVTQHNVRTIETQSEGRAVIPYDFDYAGLVDTTYAIPNKQLGLPSVRDRMYRGPCHTAAELGPYFDKLKMIKPQIMSMYDTLPDLSDGYRKKAKNYLEEFYKTISRPDEVKKELINGCVKSGI